MRAVEIIRKKRDGEKLSREEISFFVDGAKSGEITDYQVSAFLMAVFLNGMDFEETFHLTDAMLNSGIKIDLSDIPGKKIDKHSTGGVGDKISLCLAPIVASAGIIVPMISGRGLGHTGGTVDKMESINGYRTGLTIQEFKQVLKKTGCSIISQTEDIAPVDKIFYAIRDVTATVESIPLITSSIMSKKLAEDIEGLVIDMKVGKGAFMKTLDQAKRLAESMMKVSEQAGVRMKVFFTDMDTPLGYAVGNGIEVLEAIDILKGEGPEDVKEVTFALANGMLELAGIDTDPQNLVASGEPLNRFREMVMLHGGNLDEVALHSEPYVVHSPTSGIIQEIDAYKIGLAAVMTGAGRTRKEDPVDHAAGIRIPKTVGDEVKKGEPISLIYTTKKNTNEIQQAILSSFVFSSKPYKKKRRVLEVW